MTLPPEENGVEAEKEHETGETEEGDELLEEAFGIARTDSPLTTTTPKIPPVTPMSPSAAVAAASLATPTISREEATPFDLLGNAEDLVDEATVVPVPEDILPAKEFAPWHRPRKQYIRDYQWNAGIATLIDELSLGAIQRPLSYLSLPGDELLDLRALHPVCSSRGVKVRFVGYNSIDSDERRVAESQLSEAEVKRMGHIHAASSVIILDSLGDIANTKSMAHQAAVSHAPYDVVNLDLCGSLTAGPTRRPTLHAIRCLLELQLSKAGSPWLFFLTSRVGRELIDSDAQDLLHERTLQNTSSHNFCRALTALDLSKAAIETERDQSAPLDETLLQRALTLGIAKWFLGIVMTPGANWTVSMLPTCSYSVGQNGGLDMVSFGFRLERKSVVLVDPTSLTKPVLPSPRAATEEQLAIAFVTEVSQMLDVDEVLRKNTSLLDELVNRKADLLASARYDRASYIRWVSELPT